MEILSIILEIALLLGGLYLFFTVKNLLPSYFSEKGKNMATKEDIEIITEKIKTVESNINVLTGNIVDYNSIKRKIILDYFAAYNNWDRTITNADLDYSENCNEINRKRYEEIAQAKHMYNLKEGEIELFLQENEFYETRGPLTIQTLKYQQLYDITATKLNRIIQSNQDNIDDKTYEVLSEFRAESIKMVKEIQRLRKPLIILLEKYLSDMMKK
ncbi:hypothetical protein GGR22_000483 [Flavobacterium gossypii]|uniref:DUF4230 domain-containing protein n=1 Tax=Flavobacterium gossypii TaxID=1646119 RepID=A0ABR6DL04_9FLAO|nr:hypothetical protein [Flavobacterium gossypii]MBA9072357.1 hypothetical protein [Flavobacterium gossypii]